MMFVVDASWGLWEALGVASGVLVAFKIGDNYNNILMTLSYFLPTVCYRRVAVVKVLQ